jgi:hypothetical protein
MSTKAGPVKKARPLLNVGKREGKAAPGGAVSFTLSQFEEEDFDPEDYIADEFSTLTEKGKRNKGFSWRDTGVGSSISCPVFSPHPVLHRYAPALPYRLLPTRQQHTLPPALAIYRHPERAQ